MHKPYFDSAFCDQLDMLFQWRRDVRHFREDALPLGLLDRLLEQACCSPSVGNSQPWRFVNIQSKGIRRALIEHFSELNDKASEIYTDEQRAHYKKLKLHGLAQCPEVLGVFCDPAPVAGYGLGRQSMPETLKYSVVCAIHTLWLSLRARGIGMGWVSIVNPGAMPSLLSVPLNWHFVALLCIGYPATENDSPELDRSGWQKKLPLDQTIVIR